MESRTHPGAALLYYQLGDGFKIRCAVLAQGADDVIRQGFAFVHPTTNLADVALLALGLGLGLDAVLIVGVGHGGLVRNHPCLGDGADEHAVGVQIHIALHLQAHEGVDVAGQEPQAIVAAQHIDAGELVHRPAALETEVLEHREGSGGVQAVDVHHTGLLDDVVGVVLLVDGYGNPVGGVGHLRNGVDNQAVVLGAIIGGHHIQAVANVEQGRHIVLVGGGVLLCQILLAQLLGHGLNLGLAVLIQGGENLDGGIREGQILGLFEHALHDLRSQRCPGTILNQADGAVLVVPLGQVMDKFLHEGEDVSVVGGGGQNQLAIAEGILHCFGHVAAGQIVDDYLGAALLLQLLGQQLHGSLGVAVDGGVGNHDAFALHPVAGPDVVQVDVVAQILGQHRAVEGANDGDIQTGGLLQQSLNLSAVLAHDADVVPASLAGPILFDIQCTELAKTVGGEQNLVLSVISDDNLGPVNHGGGDEGQDVLAQIQGVALADHDAAVCIVVTEEVLHHGKSLG